MRRLYWLLGGVLAVAAAAVGMFAYFDYATQRALREAVAEADALDPGWRFEDMEAAREVVPDAENGAILVRTVPTLMPGRWLIPAPGTIGLEERLAELAPQQRPTEADVDELCAELAKVEAAVAKARELADRPRGRHRVAWSADLIGTLIPHIDDTRNVLRVLTLDALRRSLEGDAEGALRSAMAILNTGRALGGEPMGVSQFVRAACARDAVSVIERALATGSAGTDTLAQLQRELALEAREPLLLIAARGERVCLNQSLELMRTGKFNWAIYRMQPTMLGATGDDWIARGQAAASQAPYLRQSNQLVEISKLPPEEQEAAFKELPVPAQKLPRLIDGLMRGSDWVTLTRAIHKAQAQLHCATAALAAERYRVAEKRWPATLDALIPRYLEAVPSDPFDGKALRFRRLPDGLVIYSIGPDRTDNGGKLSRTNVLSQVQPTDPGFDLGFQLWDSDRRALVADRD
jgi:hypothetical protein